jgi:hypothetical protein
MQENLEKTFKQLNISNLMNDNNKNACFFLTKTPLKS